MIDDYDMIFLVQDDSNKDVNSDYVLGEHFDTSYLIITKEKTNAYVSSLEFANVGVTRDKESGGRKFDRFSNASYKDLSKKNIISDLKKIYAKNLIHRDKDTLRTKKIIVGIDFEKVSISLQKRILHILKESSLQLAEKKEAGSRLEKTSGTKTSKKISGKTPKKSATNISAKSQRNIPPISRLRFSFKDTSRLFSDLRLIKREDELENIETACGISDEIFERTTSWLKGQLEMKSRTRVITENEVVAFMKKQMIDFQVEESFPIIVASGKNASCPHHVPSGKLNDGFCIFDFGVKYKGYCSDMARTVYIGTPKRSEIETYFSLLKIQTDAVSEITAGVRLDSLDQSVRKKMGKNSRYFVHSLGHGVGLEVHERPFFKHDKIFQDGMVVAIEPGIYVENETENFGIRIEDMIYVSRKSRILTRSKKELIII